LLVVRCGVAFANLPHQYNANVGQASSLSQTFDAYSRMSSFTDGNGNVTDRVQYSAYALTLYRAGTNDTPFLYNGRYGVQTDPNGLLYMRARYYNPYICRFVNPDPSGFAGGLNFYCYANGNPVSLVDPFGLCPEGWGGATAAWIQQNVGNPLNSVSTSSTLANWGAYNVGSVINGVADLLRLGQGTANATYNAQDGWDMVIGITQDIGRAAGIATIVGGGLEGLTRDTAPPVVDDTPASTPVGRSGERPLTVPDGSNPSATIGGRDYVPHALDQMQSRGIPPSAVENTIRQGIPSPGNTPTTTVFHDPVNNLTVVTDTASGRVVTVHQGPP
jgi:RHS repeat-associated protein